VQFFIHKNTAQDKLYKFAGMTWHDSRKIMDTEFFVLAIPFMKN
jgi:hypothetical protein